MKNEKWLMRVIVGFTSLTTVMLLADGSFLGLLRGAVAAVILDGLIMYWDEKRVSLKDKTQRDWANGMMWAGVGIMFLFAAGYGVEIFAPVDALQSVDIFGFSFTLTLTDAVLMLAASIMGGWVVLTLGVILYMRQIDPDVKADLERTKAIEESEKERRTEEAEAYKTAMRVVNRTVGTEKAIRAFKENLKSTGYYTEFEIEQMVEDARREIQISKTGGIVNTETSVNSYRAEVPDFTQPANTKK